MKIFSISEKGEGFKPTGFMIPIPNTNRETLALAIIKGLVTGWHFTESGADSTFGEEELDNLKSESFVELGDRFVAEVTIVDDDKDHYIRGQKKKASYEQAIDASRVILSSGCGAEEVCIAAAVEGEIAALDLRGAHKKAIENDASVLYDICCEVMAMSGWACNPKEIAENAVEKYVETGGNMKFVKSLMLECQL